MYLTDGGHYDNLGLVEALRRRPKEIILIDGSGDRLDQFSAMGDAIASARMDQNIEIDFDPTALQLHGRRYPDVAWTTARATYPTANPPHYCTIKYLKCLLPAHQSWDLESYKLRNPDFPATSQKYEMYDEFDFEAFRQLGYLLMDDAEEKGWCPASPDPESAKTAVRSDRTQRGRIWPMSMRWRRSTAAAAPPVKDVDPDAEPEVPGLADASPNGGTDPDKARQSPGQGSR